MRHLLRSTMRHVAFGALLTMFFATPALAQQAPAIDWLRGDNQRLDPQVDSAPISRRITNDDSLNRSGGFAESSDVEDVRVQVQGLAATATIESIIVESVD